MPKSSEQTRMVRVPLSAYETAKLIAEHDRRSIGAVIDRALNPTRHIRQQERT